jgi:predicted acetyltransferase
MDLGGELKLQYIGDAYADYRGFLAGMRQDTHGMAFFDYGDKGQVAKNLIWVAFAQFNGTVEGLMLYRIMGEEVSKFNFVATRFYYRTSRARYLLLNWIARHIDQANRVELWLSEDEYPEIWLADIQVKVETPVRAAMNRVLDVERIGGMQVGEVNFSAHIMDPLCPWNEGSWHFESTDGILQVSRVSDADCEMTIQGLSALLAGTHDPSDIPLRGWGEVSPELQSIQRRMFPRLRPYMHEIF